MTPERQPKSLTKREMLKKLGEETVLEQSHDMVFGYPPMEAEGAEAEKEENDQTRKDIKERIQKDV